MTSPFQSYQDFYEATGPIYTFSDRPVIIALLLLASVLIFLYFIYASYTMGKGSAGEPKNPLALSILLAASAFSVAEAVYQHVSNQPQRPQAAVTRPVEAASGRRGFPLALLGLTGMAGLGGPRSRRPRGKRLSRRD